MLNRVISVIFCRLETFVFTISAVCVFQGILVWHLAKQRIKACDVKNMKTWRWPILQLISLQMSTMKNSLLHTWLERIRAKTREFLGYVPLNYWFPSVKLKIQLQHSQDIKWCHLKKQSNKNSDIKAWNCNSRAGSRHSPLGITFYCTGYWLISAM